jgi:hypothetical protein
MEEDGEISGKAQEHQVERSRQVFLPKSGTTFKEQSSAGRKGRIYLRYFFTAAGVAAAQ